nr:phage tail tape measure protein [Aliihoeflea sp. 40Bstr573]
MKLIDAAAGFYLLDRTVGRAIRASIAFEEAFADVAKVVDLDPAGLEALEKAILDISARTPMAAEEIAALMAAAAQSGVASENLAGFTEQVVKMGVAWDVAGGTAGEALAKIQTATGMSQEELFAFGDAINHVSNNMAATAPDLVDYSRRTLALGKVAGFTEEETLALGAAMIASGAQSDVAATSFNAVSRALTRGASATKRQSAAMAKLGLDAEDVAKRMQMDALGTVTDVLARIRELPAEMRSSLTSDLFGDEARAIGPLLANLDLLASSYALVGDEAAYAGSVQKEFDARSATTKGALDRLRNALNAVSISIGDALTPALARVAETLDPIAGKMAKLAGEFPGVTQAVVGATAGLIAFRVAAIGLQFVGLNLRGAMLSVSLAIAKVGGAAFGAARNAVALQSSLAAMAGLPFGNLAKARVAIGGIARAVPGIALLSGAAQGIAVAVGALTAPAWGAVALGIGAVALAGAAIWKYWDRLSSIFSGVGRAISENFAPAIEAIRPALDALAPVAQSIGTAFGTIRDTIASAIGSISGLFEREILTAEGKASFENAGYQAMNALLAGLKAAAGAVLEYVSSLGAQIAAKIKSAVTGALGRVGSLFGLGGGDTKGTVIDGARARGGLVRSGGTYLVGEEGPELRTDLGNGRIIPHRQTMDLLRGGGSVGSGGGASGSGAVGVRDITIHVHGTIDANAVADLVMRRIDEEMKSDLREVHASW